MNRLLISLMLSAGLLNTVRAQTSADETAVRNLIIAFNDAFNAHDSKAFAATFAEDADFTNWRGMSAHGRAKIDEFHVPVLTVMYKNGSQKVVDSRIRFITPDVAAVDVRSEVTGATMPDGKPDDVLRRFLLNWTVTKETTGQWLIKVMHNARLPEGEATLLNQKP